MKLKKPKKQHREDFQKKKTQPKKSMRGQPETEYGETKTNLSLSITPTGKELLKSISRSLGISTSELIERIARGKYRLVPTEQAESNRE